MFQFARMPFGLCNAGSLYCRLVAKMIKYLGSPKGIVAYLDDILLHSPSIDSHLDLIEKVLQAHLAAGVVIKAKKTFLFQKSVEFLGFQVSEQGIGMTDKFTNKVLDWPCPSTAKELSAALGFFAYYSSFIPKFAELTAELNRHKNARVFKWSQEMDHDFKALKDEFRRQTVKHHLIEGPNNSLPGLELSIDFSSKAVAAVLSQKINGKSRFSAAAGRKLKGYESRYHSSNK